MPNYCENKLRIKTDNNHLVGMLNAAASEGRLLDFIKPMPDDLQLTPKAWYSDEEKQQALSEKQQENLRNHGYNTWYDFAVAEWGTKWDIDYISSAVGDNFIEIEFDTEWAPPINAYDALRDMNGVLSVEATWHEPGMGFCGAYIDGQLSEYDNLEYEPQWIRDNVPPLILENHSNMINYAQDLQKVLKEEEMERLRRE